MYTYPSGFPTQKLLSSQKDKKWRKQNVDWADMSSMMYDNNVRQSLRHKKINYDLWNGKIHLSDMKEVLNPYSIDMESFIPENIQYYSILNAPINCIIGEELKRRFEFRAIVSNHNAISEKEKEKKKELDSVIMQSLKNSSMSDEEFQAKMKEYGDYFTYEWQDTRERSANFLLSHYIKELDMKVKWNEGMKDVTIVGEELYDYDVVGGELKCERLNPRKVFVLKNGFSGRAEDSDLIIIQDYWSPGRIVDTYSEDLTSDDIDIINKTGSISRTDDMDNIDERASMVYAPAVGDEANSIDQMIYFAGAMGRTFSNYYDGNGNIRVLRVRWKSLRKVQQIKYYNETTGEEEYVLMPEDYVPDKTKGEESKQYWINEAWEGTKIGKDIYVHMRPRKIQYNRLSNPSQCHLGVIGQMYSTNHDKPVSIVDRMKPYAYLYTVIADRLNKAMMRSYGQVFELDLAKIPEGWKVDTWLHFLKQDGIATVDSFKEGNKGSSTGKLAGQFNTTGRVLNLDNSTSINFHIQLLEWIKNEMFEIAGISKQRQGQISPSETVGGIERSVNASANITEELFMIHDNVKKRCLECIIETAKIALKNNPKKFQYILDDYSIMSYEVGGTEFAETDMGIVIDNSMNVSNLEQKIEQLAHAALQTQTLSFSTIMKLFTSSSLAQNMKIIEKDETEMRQRKQQEQEMISQQEKIRQDALTQIEQLKEQLARDKMSLDDSMNERDNQTKITVALIQQGQPEDKSVEMAKLELDKQKHSDEMSMRSAEFSENVRSNMANEQIDDKKASQKPKTSK